MTCDSSVHRQKYRATGFQAGSTEVDRHVRAKSLEPNLVAYTDRLDCRRSVANRRQGKAPRTNHLHASQLRNDRASRQVRGLRLSTLLHCQRTARRLSTRNVRPQRSSSIAGLDLRPRMLTTRQYRLLRGSDCRDVLEYVYHCPQMAQTTDS